MDIDDGTSQQAHSSEQGWGVFMSVAGATTLAVFRDTNRGGPKLKDLAKAPPDAGKQGVTQLAVIASLVPTGLIAAYTLAIAVCAGLVDEPTATNLTPNKYVFLRWVVYGFLVGLTAITVLVGYYSKLKDTKPRKPKVSTRSILAAELSGALIAAITWGLAVPDSPLVAAMHGKWQWAAPLLVTAAGSALLFALGPTLKRPAA